MDEENEYTVNLSTHANVVLSGYHIRSKFKRKNSSLKCSISLIVQTLAFCLSMIDNYNTAI